MKNLVLILRYHIWYWSKKGWYESTSTLDEKYVEELRDSYRRCGWATAVEKRVICVARS